MLREENGPPVTGLSGGSHREAFSKFTHRAYVEVYPAGYKFVVLQMFHLHGRHSYSLCPPFPRSPAPISISPKSTATATPNSKI